MGLFEGRGNLSKGMQIVRMRWAATRMGWDDTVADRFERRWLEPTESELRTALAAMDHVTVLISNIRRECE
jgi:hypothetical protein